MNKRRCGARSSHSRLEMGEMSGFTTHSHGTKSHSPGQRHHSAGIKRRGKPTSFALAKFRKIVMMNSMTRRDFVFSRVALALAGAGAFFGLSCQSHPPAQHSVAGSFASVQPVFEEHCVHCHGKQRLAHMPPFADTQALGVLSKQGHWIVPGHPEKSRVFKVVSLGDDQRGAMPPTGHALAPKEVEALRAWIKAGAALPEGNVTMTPRGEVIRSR